MKLSKIALAITALTLTNSAVAVTENYTAVERVSHDSSTVIRGIDWQNGSSGSCTGTVIAGKWVLTAAHCGKGTYINSAYGNGASVLNTYVQTGWSVDNMKLMDVAFWELSGAIQHSDFTPISTVTPADNALLRVYGFGGTGTNLGYAQLRPLANWHWGGDFAPYTNTLGEECYTMPYAILDDGYCERIPPSLMVTYQIGQGTTTSGDSGSAYLNELGYAVSVTHSNSPWDIAGATWEYHATEPTDADYYKEVASPDYELVGDGGYSNRLAFPLTQQFILETINGWNFPSWVKSVKTGETVTVKVQSLHAENVNLLNSISYTGDVTVDINSISCFAPEQDDVKAAHHSADSVAPFEVCQMKVTSNGGQGEITLDGQQSIRVNAWEVTPDNGNGGNTGGSKEESGSSGGSLGYSLIALLGLAFSRKLKK
ncbi:trypsin-like serine protease [Shewanella sp. JNE4-2]|uniref:Peptidase S1 and S6 chymotrypsin/Hap n=1 Tax=Shewanella putrefaciens (strain 200) TaxID=399804 RepID=E6XG89_SHEP2|nr:trypsin-like serine protease [Shewanella sp. JNE4-2]MCK7657699.1 trypsin-like serine protease [Shewanella sp. JNE4-2]